MLNKMVKKWTLKEDPDKDLLVHFAHDTQIPKSLSKILINRGIQNRALAKQFFVPDLDRLNDPFLMKDMDKAVDRMLQVVNEKEKILIFGDYDVDGTSGVSMFHLFLKKLNVPNIVFIPDRFTDGYGLCCSGIDKAAKENIKLIVSIDCGITAFEKVEYAHSLGIEFIICDHHQPPEKLPNALAVLDALQPECNYPFKNLCGTGVAFKLIQAICIKLKLDIWKELLDFVAVATAADMVPVIDENRILLHSGFEKIKNNPRPSYRTLINNSGFKSGTLNTSNVVFALGPRINAVGRLGDATRAVEFLTCDDESQIEDLAKILEDENSNRKIIDSQIYVQAQSHYESYINSLNGDVNNEVAIILHNPEWHPGVLGIIASRMVEKYYRPAIILTTFNGNAKGSARSISHFNIYDALKQTSCEFSGLIQFGGHFHAAGVEVEVNRVGEFRKVFNKVAMEMIAASSNGKNILVPELTIDTELDTSEINQRFLKILKHFEPFGPGNMTPLFVSRQMQIVGFPRTYHNSTHVFKVRKYNVGSNSFDRHIYDCIYYFPLSNGEVENLLFSTNDIIDIVYSIEENHWNGKTKTQFRIRDFKLSSD